MKTAFVSQGIYLHIRNGSGDDETTFDCGRLVDANELAETINAAVEPLRQAAREYIEAVNAPSAQHSWPLRTEGKLRDAIGDATRFPLQILAERLT